MRRTLISLACFVFFASLGVGTVNAADLTISSTTDIVDNCAYDGGTFTYTCNYDNIYVTGYAELPKYQLVVGGLFNSTHVIFNAVNDFVIYAGATLSANGSNGFQWGNRDHNNRGGMFM